MQKVIMWIMALGAVAGGVDHIFGDRMGLGKKFENGFMLLGPTALSMAGIICLAPLLSGVLGPLVSPLFARFGLDPAMLGSLLAIDMGGYQMAMELCADKQVGLFSGLIAGAVFGCTITFTIPVGVGMIESEDQQRFARGILLGLIAMPAALLTGGLEVTNGLTAVAALQIGIRPKFVLFSALLGWSGLCVHLQGLSFTLPLGIPARGYLRGKLLQCACAAALACPASLLLQDAAAAAAICTLPERGAHTLFLWVLIAAFLFFYLLFPRLHDIMKKSNRR